MHSLLIGIAVVLVAVWLLLLPLRLAIELQRVLHERASSAASGATEIPHDDMEKS